MKIPSVIDVIEMAKENTGAKSDARLAINNGEDPTKLNKYKKKNAIPNQPMARKLGSWAGLTEDESMMLRQIWQSEKEGDERGVQYWTEKLKEVTRRFANSLLVAATCIAPFAFSPMIYGDFK